jgi:hypothetical protein
MSLYLAPRVKRKKIHMTEDDLLQKLPDISQLKPFPVKPIYNMNTEYGMIISSSIYHNDQYIAIADEFNFVAVYHLRTTRKIWECKMDTENVISVKFLNSGLLAVTCEEYLSLINLKLNNKEFA